MKFSIDRNVFLERLNTVTKAITIPAAVPQLSGVRITALHDGLILKASDKKFTIETAIFPGELTRLVVDEPGDIVLESKYLTEIVRKLDESTLIIETESLEDGGRKIVTITDRNNFFKMTYQIPVPANWLEFEPRTDDLLLPSSEVRDLVRQIGYCTAPETESRSVLKGINLSTTPDGLFAYATDAYRLARKKVKFEYPNGQEEGEEKHFSITIPIKVMRELARSLPDDDSMVSLSISRKSIRFDVGKTVFQSLLLDGKFPDVEKIIPSRDKTVTTLLMDGKALEKYVDRTSVFYDADHKLMKFLLSGDSIKILASNDGVGNADLNLMEGEVQGSDLKLTCNGSFVLEALRGLGAQENVLIEFHGELTPFTITDPQNPDLLMLVVPIRSYD